MLGLIQNITQKIVKNNIIWKVLTPAVKISAFLNYQRDATQRNDTKDPDFILIEKLLEKSEVKKGPFTGLRYPGFESYGSSIYPKIIGSYEQEIAPIVYEIIANNYNEILDIGCAEGYYAVGFAMKCPNAKVYAYDTDEHARAYCKRIADMNGVADRIDIQGFCSNETLANFPFTKGLIFCDCEGYEKVLFDQSNLKNLSNCDLLIETHDFIDLTISGYIEDLFKNTHDITVIRSLDDITKAKTYDHSEGNSLTIHQKEKLYHEGRPHIMEWYWLKSKQ